MTFQDKLKDFGTGLAAVVQHTYHYWRPKRELPYCIWAEDGEDGPLNTNNHKSAQQLHGTVDYFTKTEYDPAADAIQEYLNGRDSTGWRLNMVQYEEDTNVIHFEWEFWVI